MTHSEPSPSRPATTAGPDPSGRTWFSEPPQTAPADEQHDTELGPDKPRPTNGPNDVIITAQDGPDEDGSDPDASASSEAGGEAIRVCDLVPLREWQAWAGTTAATQLVQETGEECAYFTPTDTVRMTVSILGAAPDSRYLDPTQRAKARPESGFSAPGYWLPGDPTSFGGTVVVELPQTDVVVCVYSRDPRHGVEDMHAAATRWASLAQDGVPK